MRAKIFFSISIIAMCLLATRALAQEGTQTNTELQELNSHPELNINDDKTLIMDGDSKPAKVSTTARDTNTPSNTNAKKQEQQQRPSSNPSNNKAEEDPLSFNFLYFIIQKFKFSDIVDN
jgi:hypothetical protein